MIALPPSLSPSTLVSAIEIAATVAFALSGLLAGARKKLDAVGLIVVAGLAAFGGGTLRDVLLDRRPFFWVDHANWLWALLLLCLGAMLFLRKRHLAVTERAMQWPDALGLGLFTATGTQLALAMGQPAIVAVLMGVITAVCGGCAARHRVQRHPQRLPRPPALRCVRFLGRLGRGGRASLGLARGRGAADGCGPGQRAAAAGAGDGLSLAVLGVS